MLLKLSAIAVSILVFSISVWSGQLPSIDWPLQGKIDLSSGFGDFRSGRFHAGVDLRTGGKPGVTVLSPVDGYVFRVSMSYYGYGKGLYIMGDDGHLYQYGHLSKLLPAAEKYVKNVQRSKRRYYIDVKPPRDSLRIAKGDFLAYTGQTGVGAPHLHFELRTADNIPLNPLTHGFSLTDIVKPVLSQIVFQMTDDHSLFKDGSRRKLYEVIPAGEGKYRLDGVPYFNRPFGLLVNGFDRMRHNGMKQSIYSLSLYIDDKLHYQVRSDSADFTTTASCNMEYDYVAAVRDKKYFRRLYKTKGVEYPGSSATGSHKGIYGPEGTNAIGRHTARIVASDALGNQSQLEFDFLWVPDELYHLDSLHHADDSVFFHFTQVPGVERLGIDSVVTMRNRAVKWGKPGDFVDKFEKNGDYTGMVVSKKVAGAVLGLTVYTEDCIIPNMIYNGIQKQQVDRCVISHEIIDEGLLIDIETSVRYGVESRVELYLGETLLGIEYPQYVNMNRQVCYVSPHRKYRHIDRIGVTLSRDPKRKITIFDDSLNLFVVGYDALQTLSVDDRFEVRIGRQHLYAPRFVEIKRTKPRKAALLGLNSAHYQILPEQFVTIKPFEIELRTTNRAVSKIVSGLCWLDSRNDKWIWLSDEHDTDTLRATSRGGGSFAAVKDAIAPSILRLNITDGRTYYKQNQMITFWIEDNVSWIKDDQNIYVKLDGEWLIPEYDPESKRCICLPNHLLKEGKHHLEITITDRAGMQTARYLDFYVRNKPATGRGQRH